MVEVSYDECKSVVILKTAHNCTWKCVMSNGFLKQ